MEKSHTNLWENMQEREKKLNEKYGYADRIKK